MYVRMCVYICLYMCVYIQVCITYYFEIILTKLKGINIVQHVPTDLSSFP